MSQNCKGSNYVVLIARKTGIFYTSDNNGLKELIV